MNPLIKIIGVILLILCLIMTVLINKFVKTESYD